MKLTQDLTVDDYTSRMIFVCGCGHSGTTLLTTMLGTHPDIYAIHEETDVFVHKLPDDQAKAGIVTKHGPFAREKGARLLCEKTPKHIHDLERIRKLFPGARIVIPIRDPRDVTLSFKKRFGDLRGAPRWLRDNAVVTREYLARNDDTFIYRYEDFIDDVEGTLKAICAHVGVDFDPKMLNYHEDQQNWFGVSSVPDEAPDPTNHATFRNWQVKQPIMDRRGLWKTQLTRDEIEAVQTACAGLMGIFRYDPVLA